MFKNSVKNGWLKSRNFSEEKKRTQSTNIPLRIQWIISRGSAIPWSPQSQDLNPLDFWLWGHLGNIIFDANPHTVPNLMQTVENACGTITPARE